MASWFAEAFGFEEASYEETRRRFTCAADDGACISLTSKANGQVFHVGAFATPSVAELREMLAAGGGVDRGDRGGDRGGDGGGRGDRGAAAAGGGTGTGTGGGGGGGAEGAAEEEGKGRGMTFTNMSGNARSLHLDASNAGAVFQVASQFNLLEMVGPGVRPQDGITRYFSDKTQGPVCAVACPAGTVYRNYFWNGVGQGPAQFDGAGDIARLVGNVQHGYWKMRNGYMLPTEMGVLDGLNARFASDERAAVMPGGGNDTATSSSSAGASNSNNASSSSMSLRDAVIASLRVGIHWDVEVERSRRKPERVPHRVCQVYSSAVPVNYTKTVATSQQWAPLASAVLEGTFEAVLSAGAVLSLQRGGERVKVFLTCVGGGAFGNRSLWIANAMEMALTRFKDFPLDVFLVHYMRNVTEPTNPFVKIEHKFGVKTRKKKI